MAEENEQHDVTEDRWTMITTAEATRALCFSSPAAFRRAWRRAGLRLYPQIGERRWLVRVQDMEKILGTPAVDR